MSSLWLRCRARVFTQLCCGFNLTVSMCYESTSVTNFDVLFMYVHVPSLSLSLSLACVCVYMYMDNVIVVIQIEVATFCNRKIMANDFRICARYMQSRKI